MKKRYALCVGINDYPDVNADLSGCVNDALDWQTTLLDRAYDIRTLLDAEATKANIVEALRERLSMLNAGDRLVFTFSGHGTWVPDTNGDESDQRDEALCCHDFARGGLLLDDEMFELFKNRKFGSRVTILSDSCHSGTVSRFVADPNVGRTPRFIPPSLISDISPDEAIRREAIPSDKPRSESVLISGCTDTEYSYDATINGRPNGAFTYFMRKALAEASSQRTSDVYNRLQALLPNPEYPQSPQLTAGLYQRNSSLL